MIDWGSLPIEPLPMDDDGEGVDSVTCEHEVVTVGHDPDGGDVWICVACGCDVAGDME